MVNEIFIYFILCLGSGIALYFWLYWSVLLVLKTIRVHFAILYNADINFLSIITLIQFIPYVPMIFNEDYLLNFLNCFVIPTISNLTLELYHFIHSSLFSKTFTDTILLLSFIIITMYLLKNIMWLSFDLVTNYFGSYIGN